VIQAVIQEKGRIIESLQDVSQTLFIQGHDDLLAGGKG
jgi:hypothetical protein